jgi:hypothetical protein
MSKITNVEIVDCKYLFNLVNQMLVIRLTDDKEIELLSMASATETDLVNLEIQSLIQYREKHRNRVRKYYNDNLRKKKTNA